MFKERPQIFTLEFLRASAVPSFHDLHDSVKFNECVSLQSLETLSALCFIQAGEVS
jgi:hypothetical protein